MLSPVQQSAVALRLLKCSRRWLKVVQLGTLFYSGIASCESEIIMEERETCYSETTQNMGKKKIKAG